MQCNHFENIILTAENRYAICNWPDATPHEYRFSRLRIGDFPYMASTGQKNHKFNSPDRFREIPDRSATIEWFNSPPPLIEMLYFRPSYHIQKVRVD
jgi:hypothetical protein